MAHISLKSPSFLPVNNNIIIIIYSFIHLFIKNLFDRLFVVYGFVAFTPFKSCDIITTLGNIRKISLQVI